MEDVHFIHETEIETEHLLPDQFSGSRAISKVEIFPRRTKSWNYTLLSAFLNQLSGFIKPIRRPYIKKNEIVGFKSQFTFTHQDDPNYFIRVIIDFEIEVFASVRWITKEWERCSIAEVSDYRKNGKTRPHPIPQVLEFFIYRFNDISDGTRCLYNHTPLLYCSIFDFSTIFNYFVKKLEKRLAKSDH